MMSLKGGEIVSLVRYMLDLSQVGEEDRERIIDLINGFSHTGIKATDHDLVFTFFLDERYDISKIPGLPMSSVRRIP